MDVKPEFRKKDIRSYVIRAGRMTAGQKKAFELYWSQFGLSLFDGQLDFARCFPQGGPVVLEIGFGMGESLLEMAEREAEKNFIGIEVHPPGVGSLLNNAANAGVNNLKIFMADAVDVLDDCIPRASVERVQLYFPDPWPKKRHHKRRIVQLPFIEKIHNALKPGGLLHMATDWQPYAEDMLEVVSQHRGFSNTAGAELYATRPVYRPITKFEKRGEKLGHGVWDLLFRKLPPT